MLEVFFEKATDGGKWSKPVRVSCGRDIYILSITASGVNYCNAGKNDTDPQKNNLNRDAQMPYVAVTFIFCLLPHPV